MDDAKFSAEFERLEAAEAEQEDALNLIDQALATEALGDSYAGRWQTDDEQLVVAVTHGCDYAAGVLKSVAPAGRFKVVQVAHNLRTLDALSAAVEQRAEAISAPLTAIGVDQRANCVVVALGDLAAPNSIQLQQQFESEPVRWEQDTFLATG